jgi:Leucine-rich repeat (LRR) protein
MNTKTYRYFCIVISLFYSSYLFAAIPSKERSALISFYHATEGSKWENNDGWLGIVGTECSWFGVTCLGGKNVTSLSLANNNLQGSIPKELSQLGYIKRINLNNNKLNNTIPAELGLLSLLSSLQLSSNQLSGSIPTELGDLTKLGLLSISRNMLSGEIPKELGKLSRLRAIFLNSNKLSGTIPAELGGLNLLGVIDLSNNKLTDSIPSSFGLLNKLKTLKLHQNHLIGAIKNILEKPTQLTHFTLYDNCFTADSINTLLLPDTINKLDIGNQNKCQSNQNQDISSVITSKEFSIEIPLIYVYGQPYKVTLERYIKNPDNPGWFWRVSQADIINGATQPPNTPSVEFNPQTTDVTFNQIHFRNKKIKATLYRYINPNDSNSFYYQYR